MQVMAVVATRGDGVTGDSDASIHSKSSLYFSSFPAEFITRPVTLFPSPSLIMGLLPPQIHPIAPRQNADPGVAPSATGVFGEDSLTADPNQASVAPTLVVDTDAPAGGGFTTAPGLVSTYTPVITLLPTTTPNPTSDSSQPSATVEASSSSSRTISMSTVIGSCVGAFIGAVALIALGFWFYRRYQRSLKASYRSRGRGPLNSRADLQRHRSHREHWGKLEDSNPEDKWEGRGKQSATEESVGPMEKLTMFKKAPSVRTAYTHTEEEPMHFEIPHPFAQQYPLYNRSQVNPENDSSDYSNNQSMHIPKPFIDHDTNPHVFSWDDATQGSFLSVRTHSERLSGAMSPSLNMAIPTPPATSSPLHRWESAEIINFDGQSAEIVNANPFEDENRAEERRKSSGNPFFGAHDDVPRRRSRSNSMASKASKASRPRSDASSVYVPVPKLDKGKGKAIDPFDDEHAPVPPAPASTSDTLSPAPMTLSTITTSVPSVIINSTSPKTPSPNAPLPPPRPAFATHVASLSGSSVSSNERALASLLAALDGDATEEEVQARLRIASMQPSINSTLSMYSEVDEENEKDMTKDFPLPPSTPGHTTPTPTLDSYVTAESDRTVRT